MSEKGYTGRMTMHLNRGSLGGTTMSELVDFAGVTIQDDWHRKTRTTVRTIFYKDTEYKTLDAAVAAWRRDHEAVERSDHRSVEA